MSTKPKQRCPYGVGIPLLLVAATCGLRQGELVARRWRDVDWTAVTRVRRNCTRRTWGTPKAVRGSKSPRCAGSRSAEAIRPTSRARSR